LGNRRQSDFPAIVLPIFSVRFCPTRTRFGRCGFAAFRQGYLVGPSFRAFAARFVAESEGPKNSEMMQKVSQKAVLKDLRD
jgi:hypothetical protein